MKTFDLTLKNLGLEGVDHINISMESVIRVGKILDPYYVKSIEIPEYGKFSSVMSYWRYLQSPDKDDRIRKLVLRELREYTKNTAIYLNRVDKLPEHLYTATKIKLSAYPNFLEELRTRHKDTLLVSYNTIKASEYKMHTGYSKLIIEVVDAIRKEVDTN